MPYGTYCLRQRSVIKYHVRFYLSIGNFIFLHLFSYYPIFISHAEIWTIVIGSGNKAVHLIFIQIHFAAVAIGFFIVYIIRTTLKVCLSCHHFSPVFLFAVLFPALLSLCREPCFLLYPLSYSDTSGNLFFHP